MLATPPPSLRDKITGRYGNASYLGPEVGSGSHIVQFRLRDGSLKIARAAHIRMLVPLTFELSSLKGLCRLLPGRAGEALLEFIDGNVCIVACSIPHFWRAQGYGMYNTCDRAAPFWFKREKA